MSNAPSFSGKTQWLLLGVAGVAVAGLLVFGQWAPGAAVASDGTLQTAQTDTTDGVTSETDGKKKKKRTSPNEGRGGSYKY